MSYQKELEKYRDIDEDEIMRGMSAEELDLELQEMDPENILLPAGMCQGDQTKKTPTGPLDRDALMQHLEQEAINAKEREDLVPFTGEKKGLFVRNVFNEVTGNELALATDMSGSLVLQKLLAVATSSQLCHLLKVLSGHWQEVCWHRSGAHVMQTALLQYPGFQSQEKTEEEEEEGEPCPHLEDLILILCSEVKEKFLLYNQDTHGSFIVRTLFQVLSGTVLNLETNKKGALGLTVSSEFDVPDSFLKAAAEAERIIL